MDILAIAGTVFGIVGIAGGATGYFKSSRGDKIITYQAREIELRDGSIARLEKDNAALGAERDRLKEENATLKQLAQGSPQLVKLTSEIKSLVQYLKKKGGH